MEGKGESHAIREFTRTQMHDRRKNEYAIAHTVPMIRIRHYEIDDTERMINKSLVQIIRGEWKA